MLQEDFRIFRSALEEGHSGIYRYTPKAELDRSFDTASKQIVRSMSALEFYRMLAPVRYPRDQKPESAADLKFLDGGRIAVLTIRQFVGSAGGRFFDDAFEQIQRQMSGNLIIDVRNNSGGADELGKKLLAFLVDQPFRYYDDLVLNAREFTFGRYVEGGGGVIPASMVERGADGKFHNIQHPNWGIQQPSQPYFAGRVLALMNGGSFSTTCVEPAFPETRDVHRRGGSGRLLR